MRSVLELPHHLGAHVAALHLSLTAAPAASVWVRFADPFDGLRGFRFGSSERHCAKEQPSISIVKSMTDMKEKRDHARLYWSHDERIERREVPASSRTGTPSADSPLRV
jgi:hypothetical protein